MGGGVSGGVSGRRLSGRRLSGRRLIGRRFSGRRFSGGGLVAGDSGRRQWQEYTFTYTYGLSQIISV